MNTMSTASDVCVCDAVEELIVEAFPAVNDELTLPAVNDELTLPAVNVEFTVVVELVFAAAFAPVRFAVLVRGWLWYAFALPSPAT